MGRGKHLSGNDLFMLSRLRDGVLWIRNPVERPVSRRWFDWHGLRLAGDYSKVEWRDWPLPPEQKERRGQPKRGELGGLSFGNTTQQTRRLRQRKNNAATRFTVEMAVCLRLLEYEERNLLGAHIRDNPKKDSCYRVLKRYRVLASCIIDNDVSRYDKILTEEWGLPPLIK